MQSSCVGNYVEKTKKKKQRLLILHQQLLLRDSGDTAIARQGPFFSTSVAPESIHAEVAGTQRQEDGLYQGTCNQLEVNIRNCDKHLACLRQKKTNKKTPNGSRDHWLCL